MRRYLASDVRSVKLGVGVGRVTIATPATAEHHVASWHRALVHLSQVNSGEVDLEGALVTECLETHITLDSLLASRGVDKAGAQVLKHCIKLSRRLHGPPPWSLSLLSVRRQLLAPAHVDRTEQVLVRLRLWFVSMVIIVRLSEVVEPRCGQLCLIW